MYFQPYGNGQQLNLNWIINEIIELHKQLDPDYETPKFSQIYPYSNLEQLNLDWILSELKTLKELAPEPVPQELDIQAVAEALVALPFDSNKSYQIYDFISRDGEIWRATEAVEAGSDWNESQWFNTKIGTDLAVLERWINAIDASVTTLENTKLPHLKSTGDITDRYADIMRCLNLYGCCVLGNGVFYINSTIGMPDNTTLSGVGANTVLQLADDAAGQVAVNVGSYCLVKDMTIKGSSTQLPYSSYTRGNRKGIALLGDYTDFNTGTYSHNFAKLSNLTITDFNHSGIWAYKNDGAASFLAENIDILRCHTGIDIELFSEFHSFTNIRCRWCNIACVMQGGNNLFNNCHFDVNLKNLHIDGTQSGVINAAHSSFSNCTFCHPDNNTGDNMEIISMVNGLIFTSCQFWYGKIKITDTTGLTITNSVIAGTNNNIIVTSSNQINISNNLFKNTPAFSFVNQTVPIIINANILNDGSIYNSTYSANPSETFTTNMMKYGETPSIQAENIGMATSNTQIAVFIFFPWYVVGNYDVTIERVVLLGETTQPTLADVAVNTKQPTGFRLAIPYETTQRTPYQVNVIYKLTSRYWG